MITQPDSFKRASVFPVWCVRVTNSGNIPHDIQIVLPGTTGTPDSERQPNALYIEDYLPDADSIEHHTVLGEFVDSWSRLELALSVALSYLIGCDLRTAHAVFNGLGMKRVMEVMLSLATMKLGDKEILETTNLLDRLSKINRKRNVVVHGQRTVEFVVWGRGCNIMHKTQLLRETKPIGRTGTPVYR